MENPVDWIAIILEIRAADELHVFARMYWVYSPEELKPGSIYGKTSLMAPRNSSPKTTVSSHPLSIKIIELKDH